MYKKHEKVWYTRKGKERLPAIIKEVTNNEIILYVLYNIDNIPFWMDDVTTSDSLEKRSDDFSQELYKARTHLL